MTMEQLDFPKAFAVSWKDFDYWQVRALGLSLTNKCNWPTVRLGDICTVRSEIVPAAEVKEKRINLLDRISFNEGRIFSGKRTITRMVQFRAKPGDIVVSKINARKRAIGIVKDGPDIGITIHFRSLIPDTHKIEREFLWAALRSKYCMRQFEAETGGIGKGEISEEKLLEILVPLPPIKAQKAITAYFHKAQIKAAASVAQITELESRVPVIMYNELGVPPPPIMGSRQKVLGAWWKELQRWSFSFLSSSRQGLNGFGSSQYPIARLGEYLVETMNGYCIKPVEGPTPYKMLKLNALQADGLDLNASKYVDVPKSIEERFYLRKNDILICRSNAFEYVAKSSLVREDQPNYLFPDIIIRARVMDKLLPEYVVEVIQTPLGRSYFQTNSRRAVGGMWKISSKDIHNFPIPIPPREVQKRIINKISRARAEIVRKRETIASLLQETAAEVEAMLVGTKPSN